MLEAPQKCDFPQCSARDPIVLLFQIDLLDGDSLIELVIVCFVHNPIGARAHFLLEGVALLGGLRCRLCLGERRVAVSVLHFNFDYLKPCVHQKFCWAV